MHWIDPSDLDRWADAPSSAAALPNLIRRLIVVSAGSTGLLDVPGGSSMFAPGWDGAVSAEVGTDFVPQGMSGWELSVRRACTTKANADFDKRTADPRGMDRASSTFVYVTPRVWGTKDEWIAKKRELGAWRDVRAYDASDIAQWLDSYQAIGASFARELGKIPASGVVALDEYWEEWSKSTSPPLSTSLVLAGREDQAGQLGRWVEGPPAQFFVKGETRTEAIAFVAAAGKAGEPAWGHLLFSKALVVQNEEALRALGGNHHPLVLIADMASGFSPQVFIDRGHHVLVPLGNGESATCEGCALPRIARDQAREALEAMGLSNLEARALIRKTARSVPVIRRRLIDRAGGERPPWAEAETGRKLVPALLAGQWIQSKDRDQEILHQISGRLYSELEVDFTPLLSLPDAPLRRIGNAWRLTSQEEAWELLARFLTTADLRRFAEVAVSTLNVASPEYEMPPEERYMAGVQGRVLEHSGAIREGIAQTLALMGSRPEASIAAGDTALLAARIVREVLANPGDWRLWATLGRNLSALAEAAPEALLDKIEEGLAAPPQPFQSLFAQDTDDIFGGCPHAGLLWALERLAWSREHFSRVAAILARLAEIDPGGRYSNRPAGSLRCLFLHWIRASAATDAERLVTLESLIDRQPEVGWTLLMAVCPKGHGDTASISGTEPEWREWGHEAKRSLTRGEAFEFATAVTKMAIAKADRSVARWAGVIEVVGAFPPKERQQAIFELEKIASELREGEGSHVLWVALRNLLHHHRSCPDADWALPTAEVDRFAAVYAALEPSNHIARFAWLFSSWPRLPDGERRDIRKYEERMKTAREAAVREVLQHHGIAGLFSLCPEVEAPWTIGGSAASVVADDEVYDVVDRAFGDQEVGAESMALALCGAVHRQRGWQGFKGIIDHIKSRGASREEIARVFHAAPADSSTWDRVAMEGEETDRLYWSRMRNVHVIDHRNDRDLVRAATSLLDAQNAIAAQQLLGHAGVQIPSDVVVRTLELLPEAVRQAAQVGDVQRVDGYEIAQLFSKLDQAAVSREAIARLEIPFVEVLEHHRHELALHKEVVSDSATFGDLIAWTYNPSDNRAETDDLTEEQRENRARCAWQILFHLRRVPGQQEDGTISVEELVTWAENARRVCEERGRGDFGDDVIGQILANSPTGADGAWPCEAVRETLERFQSPKMGQGFEVAKHNLRGVTSRGPYDGGGQERGLASGFRRDADSLAPWWPFTAGLLRSLARSYEWQGRSEDDQANWRDQD